MPALQPHKIINIPNGSRGVTSTLKIMRRLIVAARPSIYLRDIATTIVRDLFAKDFYAEANKVMLFVRKEIRYVRDIESLETISTPEATLKLGQGDCDDMVILCASLLQSIGFKSRLLAVGFDRDIISHVMLECLIDDKWVGIELTENLPLGSYPPNIQATKVMPI